MAKLKLNKKKNQTISTMGAIKKLCQEIANPKLDKKQTKTPAALLRIFPYKAKNYPNQKKENLPFFGIDTRLQQLC